MNQIYYNNYEYIINEHIGLVYTIASRFKVSAFDRDDLIQAGLMGLITAASRFDIQKGYKFSTFAVPYILGSIKKELRSIKPEIEKFDVKKYLELELMNRHTSKELSEELLINKEDLILELSKLTLIEKEIFILKFKDNLTESKIAEMLNISQSTVSRKLKRIIERVRR